MTSFELDPYEELGLTKEATDADINKAYRKLCLKYHPDKLVKQCDEEKLIAKEKFEKVLFAYSVLHDPKRKKRYDDTGSLSEVDSGDFDWKDYFQSQVKVTKEMIDEDRKMYQGSVEEEDDIIEEFEKSKGDFLALFETIPHLEFSMEEEERVSSIVEKLIKSGSSKGTYSKWDKYKKQRKKKALKYQRKMAKEAEEAEDLKRKLNIGNEKDLKSLIQKKNSSSFDGLLSHLENKYGGSKVTKSSKKSRKPRPSEYEIDDAEFEKLQLKLKKKSK